MYHLYVNERSKVLRLLLMLASRLARADNALLITNVDFNDHRVISLIPLFVLNVRELLAMVARIHYNE